MSNSFTVSGASQPAPLSDEKAQLARVILLGHDLRAAVSDILGGLRMISHETLDDTTRLQLERMRAAGEVMARLIEEGLDIVAEQTTCRQAIQTARLLYDLEMRWSGRAQEKGLDFHVALAPDVPPMLEIDRLALERILANMLSNAIKYTDRGRVRVIATLDTPERMRITVLDDGPGFSPAALERLFEYGGRGEDTGKPGYGLGMFISRDMAGRLGGLIEVENRPSGGARVALTLPLGALPPPAPEEGPLPDLAGCRVLIADDSAVNRAVLHHMLTTLGASCDFAVDGLEALRLCEALPYDLAVLDVEMPRLSGIELMRRLRAGPGPNRALPIVACTAYVLRANREALQDAGADAIVAKPLTRVEPLARAIVLATGRGAPQPPERAATAALAELDIGRFERLIEIAGPEGAPDLVERLASDLARVERNLVTALTQIDRDAIRAETHTLVAIAGAVGADRLRARSEALNACAHGDDLVLLRPLGREVLSQLDRLIHFTAQRRSALTPPGGLP
ncbi:MAG: ATP-binding protein [Paenirhodobacter sp.]|uniref:ATP-binding protein n=1 Tax=Paenirhodobacter sp. TaxID=1965326 RepID=UPI003D145371